LYVVEDFNLALSSYRLESVYGLFSTSSSEVIPLKSKMSMGKQVLFDMLSLYHWYSFCLLQINICLLYDISMIVEILKQPAPRMPVRSEAIHHWLAVEGIQPLIPENPTPTSSGSANLSSVPFHSQDTELLTSLPREMQVMYILVFI
jgi:hypothetical protein